MNANETFLIQMRNAAASAGHLYPEYAACEAALATRWGKNTPFLIGWNCFNSKQRAKPEYQTTVLATTNVINGHKVQTVANFIKFPDLPTAFEFRMDTLKQWMAIYREALTAKTGEDFIRNVSGHWLETDKQDDGAQEFTDGWFKFVRPRWATDPLRAAKVLEIYESHKELLSNR